MIYSATANSSNTETRSILLDHLFDLYRERGVVKLRAAYDDCDNNYLRQLIADVESEPPSETAFFSPRPVPVAPQARHDKPQNDNTRSHRQSRTTGRKDHPWRIDDAAGKGYWLKMPLDAALDHRLADGDCRLLLILMHHCRDKDHCWPSEELLASELVGAGSMTEQPNGKTKSERTDKKVSTRTIKRRIANLKAAEYITVIRPDDLAKFGYSHQTTSNTYRLNLETR